MMPSINAVESISDIEGSNGSNEDTHSCSQSHYFSTESHYSSSINSALVSGVIQNNTSIIEATIVEKTEPIQIPEHSVAVYHENVLQRDADKYIIYGKAIIIIVFIIVIIIYCSGK